MKKTRAKIWLTSLLLTSSPNVHAQIESNTNTDLVETLTKGVQEVPWDVISFEDAQNIKESIHKFMDTEWMKELLKKHNYNQKDAENIIYKMLTSDSWKQLLTELSHDKNIQDVVNKLQDVVNKLQDEINKSDINAIEEKIKEKDIKEYMGVGLLVLAGLAIWYCFISWMKTESVEQDPYN